MIRTSPYIFMILAVMIGFVLAVLMTDAKCFLGDPFTPECLAKYSK